MATQTPVNAILDETALTSPRLSARQVIYDWLTTVDHKKIGLMYIGYALLFLVIGGFEAILMRIQLAIPNNHFVSPQSFNQLFTMHGTTMVFFVGMPILFGFGNYLIPLMIGARDMAFPRLNAFSFWISAFGGFLLYFSYLGAPGLAGAGSAPDVGWWAYAPLTAHAFSPGHSTDYWTLALLLTGLLYLVMRRSRIGRAIVAVRMDGDAAALMGIEVNRIYAITFGIAAMMAGAAGAIFAMVYPVTTNLTGTFLGKAFVVCVIGGLGSVPGALAGGIVLGIIESFAGQFFGPQHALTVGFVLMLVLLVVRPTGLTGIKGYE